MSAGLTAVTATLTIYPNGSVSVAGILSVSGSTYTLLAPYTGSIADERNGSTLDGAHNKVTYTSGTAIVSVWDASNVTLERLNLSSQAVGTIGVYVASSSQVTVVNDTIATRGQTIDVISSGGVDIENNSAPNGGGLWINLTAGVQVLGNDLSHSNTDGVVISGSSGIRVVGNDVTSASGTALYMLDSGPATITDNRLNGSGYGFGLDFYDVVSVNASGNYLGTSGQPVSAVLSSNVVFSGNTIGPGSAVGYFLLESSRLTVEDTNSSSALSEGVLISHCTGISVLNSKFDFSRTGVDIEASSHILIRNVSALGGQNGIYAANSSEITVDHSDLENPNNALYAVNSSGILVRNSNLSRANYALNLTTGTHDVLVESSDLDAEQIGGVYLNGVANVTVDRSTIRRGALYAVSSADVSGLTISSTNLSGTKASPALNGVLTYRNHDLRLINDSIKWTQNPYIDQSSQGVQILHTDLSNATNPSGAGIALSGTSSLIVNNSNFYNDTRGITGFQVADLQVRGSNFGADQFDGIVLNRATGISITGDSFDNLGGIGVYIVSSQDVVATGNRLNNFSYAFFFNVVDNALLAGNTAELGRDGVVSASYVKGLVIEGNVLSNASDPNVLTIFAYQDSPFLIEGNRFTNDGQAVISTNSNGAVIGNQFLHDNISVGLFGSDSVLLYHNDFVGDVAWQNAAPAVAQWNAPYPVGGNYWSNYTGRDAHSGASQNLPGADGFGDTPEVLNASNSDRYPLMTPWADHAALFVESGLQRGTVWGVIFNGTSYTTTASSLTVSSTVGVETPYVYSVLNVPGYVVTPASGSGTLGAGLVTVSLAFSPRTYAVVFNETGLPTGTSWGVVLNGSQVNSTNATVTFHVPAGNYPYSVAGVLGYNVTPSSGAVLITTSAVTVLVVFTVSSAPTYPVLFVESGLPTGTAWSVTVGGRTLGSTNTTIQFHLPSGTGTYSVGAVPGYLASPSAGPLIVAGAAVAKSITFTPLGVGTFEVIFLETGLPGGTAWSATLNGVQQSSTTGLNVFTEPNGTYAYTVGGLPGFISNPASGTISVSGAAQGVVLGFIPVAAGSYVVTFAETGLPVGSSWSVNLSGVTRTSTGTSIQFSEPNGSYTFAVSKAAGEVPVPATGSLTVAGTAVTRSVMFATGGGGGASPVWTSAAVYWLLSIVAVGLAGCAGFLLGSRRRKPGPGTSQPPPTEPGEGAPSGPHGASQAPPPPPGNVS